MLDAGVIETVEEYEWIIPMLVQDKKTVGEVCICIDMRKMNDSFLHEPFMTPFKNEVFESVGDKKIFTY